MEHLKGKTIVLARAEEQSKETLNFFKNIGVNLISFPSLVVVPVEASQRLKTILETTKIDYLVFQSENAVKYFSRLVKENNLTIDYENIRVACYGKKIAASCSANNIKVDLVPSDFSITGLLKIFLQEKITNKVILLPDSGIERDGISERLKRFGAIIKKIAVYDIQIPQKDTITEIIDTVKNSTVDWYLFISPETYQNFLSLADITNPASFFKDSKIAAVGESTQEAIEATNVRVDVTPKKFAITHAIASIEKYYALPQLPRKNLKPKQGLKNRTIVLTRAEEQSTETINFFKNKEVNLISFPVLEVVPVDASEKLKIILEENQIEYLVFQSANSVKYFVQLVKEKNLELNYEKIKVACVGKKTAAFCAENNIKVDLVPEDFSALGLLKLFAIEPLDNKTVLLPRSAIGRDELREGLKRYGATVKTISVYDIHIPKKESVAEEIEKIKSSKVDWYLFTSPSSYQNFLALLEVTKPTEFFAKSKIAAIGPTTKEAIEKTRVKVDVVPLKYSVNHAIKSIEDYYYSAPEKKLPRTQFQKKSQFLAKLFQPPQRAPEKKVIRYVLKKRKPRNES